MSEKFPHRHPDPVPDLAGSGALGPGEAERYIRAKVDQLLAVIGTCELEHVSLQPRQLIELDPIGIIADAFRQVIEQMNATNQRFNAMLDAAQEVAIISCDAGGLITVFNHGAERMLGYAAHQVLGRSPLMFHREHEVERRRRELAQQLGRPVPGFEVFTAQLRASASAAHNWTYVRQDGAELTASMVITEMRNPHGDLIGYLAIARDISEQLAAEAALLQLNMELDRRVQLRTEALLNSTEQLQATLTELRHTQNQLVQSEKLAGLGAIVAAVAHELNTPIGNCVTVASALRDDTAACQRSFAGGTLRRSELGSYLDTALGAQDLLMRGLNRVVDQVTSFKQVAVDQSGAQQRQFELHDIVGNVVALMNATLRKTPYRLELEIPTGIAMDSYPGAIEQIVCNLINNSVLHGFDGRDQGLMRLCARVLECGRQVEIIYTDDGCGMSEKVLNHVFDPFFTTRLGKGGSGLGMHICYNLASGPLGGGIGADSAEGRGCRFILTLPLAVRPAPTHP